MVDLIPRPDRYRDRAPDLESVNGLIQARIDGVTAIIASGSLTGSASGASSLWRAWCHPSSAIPAIKNSTLNTVHMNKWPGGVLPTSSSCGQLFV